MLSGQWGPLYSVLNLLVDDICSESSEVQSMKSCVEAELAWPNGNLFSSNQFNLLKRLNSNNLDFYLGHI